MDRGLGLAGRRVVTFVLIELDDPLENARSLRRWDWPSLLDNPNVINVDTFDTEGELEAAARAISDLRATCGARSSGRSHREEENA
jgi:hypothetical protein